MDKSIQGNNEAWNRLSGGNQSNPGNRMEYPSHTNSRGYASHRHMHAEGDNVESEEHRRGGHCGRRHHEDGGEPEEHRHGGRCGHRRHHDEGGSSDDDSDEGNRRGGRPRSRHDTGGQPGYPSQAGYQAAAPQQAPMAQQPMAQQPQQAMPAAQYRRGGNIR